MPFCLLAQTYESKTQKLIFHVAIKNKIPMRFGTSDLGKDSRRIGN